jgi:hypothetical protein
VQQSHRCDFPHEMRLRRVMYVEIFEVLVPARCLTYVISQRLYSWDDSMARAAETLDSRCRMLLSVPVEAEAPARARARPAADASTSILPSSPSQPKTTFSTHSICVSAGPLRTRSGVHCRRGSTDDICNYQCLHDVTVTSQLPQIKRVI